ncbi:hypothetical protein Sjap_017982 [Stephania japonica]|uniref:Formamidopyrimidine-DNA glycosylase-like C-terminal domain-containing protein n=1 Tax=Stephania japonica TaxID=461633 RepID=A0AAP0I754_9MAGN
MFVISPFLRYGILSILSIPSTLIFAAIVLCVFCVAGLNLECHGLSLPAVVPPISELGPDALTEPMTLNVFVESLSKKKIAIKALHCKKIEFITAGGRTTAYVPELPKLPEDQAKKELAKATKHSHGDGEEE